VARWWRTFRQKGEERNARSQEDGRFGARNGGDGGGVVESSSPTVRELEGGFHGAAGVGVDEGGRLRVVRGQGNCRMKESGDGMKVGGEKRKKFCKVERKE